MENWKYAAGALLAVILTGGFAAFAQPGNVGNAGVIEDLSGGGPVSGDIDMDDGSTTGPELQFSDGSNLRLRLGVVGSFPVIAAQGGTLTFQTDIGTSTSSASYVFRTNSFSAGGGNLVMTINEGGSIEGPSATILDLGTDGDVGCTDNAGTGGCSFCLSTDCDERIEADGNFVYLYQNGSIRLRVGSSVASLIDSKQAFITGAKTSDPCGGAVAEASLFYNDTSDYLCFCDGAATAKQAHSPATNCF